ncbi:MAG: MarR family winged helix-turn-helix transcriptional regulator [Thermoplasmata archaeon]
MDEYSIDQIIELKKSLNDIYKNIIPKNVMNKTEIIFLLKINEENKITPTKLSKLTGFSKSMVTMTLENLEKNNMIKKIKGNDKRVTYIILTEKGKKYSENIVNEIKNNLGKLIKKVPKNELEEFTKCIEKMNHYLKYLI